MGYPIRKSPDRSVLAAPRSLSQLIASFFAYRHQGIHHVLFVAFDIVHSEIFYEHRMSLDNPIVHGLSSIQSCNFFTLSADVKELPTGLYPRRARDLGISTAKIVSDGSPCIDTG